MPTLSSHIIRQKLASVPDVEEALARQVLYGGDLVTNLLELSRLSEPKLVEVLAQNFGLEAAPPGVLPTAMPEVKKLIGGDVALRYSIFPLRLEDGRLELAVFEPLPAEIEQDLVFSLGVRVVQRVAPLVRIRQAIARDYEKPLDKRTARVVAQLDGRSDPHPSLAPSLSPPEGRGIGRLARPQSVLPPPVSPEVRNVPPPVMPEVRKPLRPLSASAPEQRTATKTSTVESAARSTPARRSNPALVKSIVAPVIAPSPVVRRRGPYTASMAEQDLFSAESRDQVLFALFDFASQYFEYTALFVVHGEVAEGRLAKGPGATSEQVQKLGIPLDLESALASAYTAGNFKLVALANTGVDSTFAQDLARPTGRRVLFLPVTVRSRTVLILYGDHGRTHVKLSDVGDVLGLGALVGATLERLIVTKKGHGKDGSAGANSLPPLPRPGSQFSRLPRKERAEALLSALGNPAENTQEKSHEKAFAEGTRHSTLPGLSGPSVSVLPRAIDVTPPMGTPIVASTPPGARRSSTPAQGSSQPQAIISAPPPPPTHPPPPLSANAPSPPQAPPPPPSRPNVEFSEPLPIPLTRSKLPQTSSEPPESGWDVSGAAPAGTQHLEVIAESERGTPASRSVSVAALQPRPARKSDSHHLPTVIVDLASNCQKLVAELIVGDTDAASQLLQIGGPAAAALAAKLPGPLQLDYKNGLGEVQIRATQCGPLLRTLGKLGMQAAPFVALRTVDEDPSVRAWATHLLAEMPGEEAARAIVKRLFDDDPEVRKVAISAGRSMQSNSGARLCFLEQLAAYCSNLASPPTVRIAAIEAMESLREPQGVPTLIALLEEEGEVISRSAHQALITLTREDLGTAPAPWKTWWNENRTRHRIEWLIEALMSESSNLRSAASEELKSLTKEYFGYYEDLPKRERARAQQRYREWWESRGKARFD